VKHGFGYEEGMRCDLHVHTLHSGMCTVPVLRRICRESYSDPRAVYETLKRRGMDLVTITDHDSIDAAESLRSYPDFFLSEEVSAISPSGTEMHVGVYDIQERHHLELQRLRADLLSLIAYLDEQQIFFTINHVYSSLTGRRTEADCAFEPAGFRIRRPVEESYRWRKRRAYPGFPGLHLHAGIMRPQQR
jgi:predicted metal-dependent phosphoesterase TrpH